MNNSLTNKLLREIKKTGYPLELKVGGVFSKCGWRVKYNRYYLDRDEQKGREIDISAYTNAYQEPVYVGLHLVCEVKQSLVKPWVIFSTEMDTFEIGGWAKLQYAEGIDHHLLGFEDIDKGSSLSKFARIGRSYCEGYKSANESSLIFKALASAVKASEDCLERNQKAGLKDVIGSEKAIHFVDPIVVLDGLLYEAYLDEKEELQLNETGHIPVSFGYISPQYRRHGYLIDMVTIKELPNLLADKKEWIKGIKDILLRKMTHNG